MCNFILNYLQGFCNALGYSFASSKIGTLNFKLIFIFRNTSIRQIRTELCPIYIALIQLKLIPFHNFKTSLRKKNLSENKHGR